MSVKDRDNKIRRLLLVNSVCGTGSTGRICTDIAKEYESKGWEVKIAYGRENAILGKSRSSEKSKYGIRIGTDIDVLLHGAVTRLYDLHGFGSKRATRKFLRWADEYNPDLLWLHNIHGYYVNIEELFLWIKVRQKKQENNGLPVMQVRWTLHDCWAFTGHCAYFGLEQSDGRYVNCNRWQNGCHDCPKRNAYPRSCFFDGSIRNFSTKKRLFNGVQNMVLITPSQWLLCLTKKSFLENYSAEVVPNKIDKAVFKFTPSNFRKEHGLENKFMVLGVANVWDSRKGLKDFVMLNKLLDAAKYQIVLVGVDERQKKSLQREGILSIPKLQNVKALVEIYSSADVFFNPTYEDNLPTVNLEAEACGIPVITYDIGGCPETVHNENSKIIPAGDIIQVYKILSNTS